VAPSGVGQALAEEQGGLVVVGGAEGILPVAVAADDVRVGVAEEEAAMATVAPVHLDLGAGDVGIVAVDEVFRLAVPGVRSR